MKFKSKLNNSNVNQKRSLLMGFFGLFLIINAMVLVSSFWQTSAQKQSSDKVEIFQTEKNFVNYDEILRKANDNGSVPIIVGFESDFTPEGKLTRIQRDNQRTKIKFNQTKLLDKIINKKPENVKHFDTIPYIGMTVNSELLTYLINLPEVTFIREDEISTTMLGESVPLIGTPIAWNLGFTGSGWSVAVLDTGVDKTHSFLTGKVISEACYSSNFPANNISSVCPGAVSNSTATGSGVNCSSTISGCDHGTHVAGIAAGTNASISGVAKNGSIIAIQVFSRFGNQSDCQTTPAPCSRTYRSDQILGLQRVLALSNSTNIAAVNMSLGGGQFFANCNMEYADMKAAIDNLDSVGIATVIASGNNGFTDSISGPACISTAVSVGSTGLSSTIDNNVSSFSNSASFLSLLAPGYRVFSSIPGNIFEEKNGTSMATPHVAGAWAILKQKKPNATVTEVRNAFTSTGLPITDSRNGIVKPRIRVDLALNALSGSCPSPTAISIGQTVNGTLQAGDCVFTDNSLYDGYTFSGTAGQQIFIAMNSAQFNTYLLIYQGSYPGGTIVRQDDNGGGGTNARIPATSGFFPLPATGTYTILANSSVAGLTGSYSLTLGTNSNPVRRALDFDGDGKTDISVFRRSVGEWYWLRSGNGVVNGVQFGSSTDKPVPADYTGDGKTDIAFWRPSTGQWFILRSEDFSFYAFPFGISTDIPSPGDFDGDGKADQAVFRPSNGVWYINRSTGGTTIQPFGTNGDRTVVADYDGDGKSDIAIFRPSVGEWYYLRSSDSQVRGAQFGAGSDKTVQGDYTGDGKADFAFFRPSTGNWFVLRSEDFSFFASPFGLATDIPTIGDYDGDGKFDQAVFRPSNGVWYLNRSTAGVQIQQFGAGTDMPLPSYYLP